MASVVLNQVTVDYPIYGASHRSLRTMMLGSAGGLIRREGANEQRIVVRALEDISFSLGHGDRLGLVGPNGAGKSTLLRLLAGVFEPVGGTIKREGKVSALFVAAPGMDVEDTGYENINTCGMLLGMTPDEIVRKLPDIEEFCELGNYLALPVRTYSAGMQMRLSFALATALDPDILILDEGLGAGDARFSAKAAERMQRLVDRSSIMILASHADSMIAQMCNKAALLEGGKLVAIGPVDEIIAMKNQHQKY